MLAPLSHSLSRLAGSCGVLLAILAPPLRSQAPVSIEGPFIDLPRVPADAPLPAWLATGARVTYFAGTSSLPSVSTALARDDRGQLFTVRQESSGGGGLAQYDFVHVGAEIAVRASTFVYADAGLQNVTLAGHQGHVGDRSGVLDIWIHPQRLQAVVEEQTESWMVRRMPYVLEGREYRAITARSSFAGGYVRHTYDLETGLLLVHSSASTGKPVWTGTPSNVALGAGAVTVTTVQLRAVRRLGFPWLGAPERLPAWLARGQRCAYSGSETSSLSQGLLPPWPFRIDVRIEKLAQGFALADTQSTVSYGGAPSTSSAKMVYGAGTVGSLFLDPHALARLQPGQTLDEDPITHYAVRCTAADAQCVVLVEEGPLQGMQFTFARASGQLVHLASRLQQGPALLTRQAQLEVR